MRLHWLIRCAAATLVGGMAVACQPARPTLDRGGAIDAPGGLVAMQPGWRGFLEQNYRGEVLAAMPPMGIDTAEFAEPKLIASRSADGSVQLQAVGDVTWRNISGKHLRQTYALLWQQHGNAWDLIDRTLTPPVQVAAPAEQPAAPGSTPPPTSRPATRPAP